MTPANLLAVVRMRWLLIAFVVLVTAATATGVSLSMPKKYVATASVVVDARPDPISALIYPGLAGPSFMNTQFDILNSDRVALRVVRDLKLDEDEANRQRWQQNMEGKGSIEQWLVAVLRGNVDIKASKDSNVVTVSYQVDDAQSAADIANAYVQGYINTTLELRVDPARQYAAYFNQQTQAARQALETAQTKLSKFERDNGIIASDQRLDVESARLNELSSQLVAVQALATESSSRQSVAGGTSADRLQEVLTNPTINQIKADLSRAEARLQELSARFGDNHPQLQEARASVTDLRSRLDTETRRVSGGAIVANTINQQREAGIRTALEAQRAKVLRMKALRDEAAVLQREVESAQRAFEGVTARLNQTSLESQSTQSNASILTRAEPPVNAAFPRTRINAALGLVVGTVLGLGLALMLEFHDRRLRVVEDIGTVLQLPLLGVIPGADGTAGARQRMDMKLKLLGLRIPAARERS
ncbi:MAG: chain length determinant protein EpsF [Rubrivivax sp.]